jgi:hypothetical protein
MFSVRALISSTPDDTTPKALRRTSTEGASISSKSTEAMSAHLDRPKLTRPILEAHGIYYHKVVYMPSGSSTTLTLPRHVNELRAMLLDTSRIKILDGWKGSLQEDEGQLREKYDDHELDLYTPESAFVVESTFEYNYKGENWKGALENYKKKMRDARAIRQEASELHDDAEEGWLSFLKEQVFKKYRSGRFNDDDVDLDEYSLYGFRYHNFARWLIFA